MNRTQIAKIYDEFPESQRDMPREQFIREALGALGALDPNRMAADADAIVQRRITGRMNQMAIDEALQNEKARG
uniref:Uncharacterized protein n=1 Tax=viral metagenome TaxID=1070528 RepID=A0A6M3LEA8_9ZZZZ